MAELKKCPFCGGEARSLGFRKGNLITKPSYVDGESVADAYFVKCNVCDCQTGVCVSNVEAGEKWNNRATEAEISSDAIEEFAEQLHELCGVEIGDCQYPDLLHERRIDEIAEKVKGEKK